MSLLRSAVSRSRASRSARRFASSAAEVCHTATPCRTAERRPWRQAMTALLRRRAAGSAAVQRASAAAAWRRGSVSASSCSRWEDGWAPGTGRLR